MPLKEAYETAVVPALEYNDVLEYVAIEGWHVDVRSKTPLDFLEPFVVVPKNPIHSFM